MALPVLRDERLTLRPLDEDDVEALVAVLDLPGVREWWGPSTDPEEEREELRNDGSAYAIEVEGALAGWLAVTEERDPGYEVASFDIVLAPPHQGRGLGPAALRLAIEWLVAEHGHHRFAIDPALANERAIRAYAKVGFRRVGVMRRYERGPDGSWHDNLLMDLLAEELTPASGG